MQIKEEYYDNFLDYFPFEKGEKREAFKKKYKTELFTLNGLIGRDFDSSEAFFLQCNKKLISFFCKKVQHLNYYFFIRVEVKENSRIDNYMKVWKKLEKKSSLKKFELGLEILYTEKNISYYSSILKFKIEDINEIFKMQFENLFDSFIFISEENIVFNKNHVLDVFKAAYSNDFKEVMPHNPNPINYYALIKKFYNEWNYLLRIGCGGEDYSIDTFIIKNK